MSSVRTRGALRQHAGHPYALIVYSLAFLTLWLSGFLHAVGTLALIITFSDALFVVGVLQWICT